MTDSVPAITPHHIVTPSTAASPSTSRKTLSRRRSLQILSEITTFSRLAQCSFRVTTSCVFVSSRLSLAFLSWQPVSAQEGNHQPMTLGSRITSVPIVSQQEKLNQHGESLFVLPSWCVSTATVSAPWRIPDSIRKGANGSCAGYRERGSN